MNMNDFIEVLQEKKVPYAIDGDKIVVAENLDLCDTDITSLPDNLIACGWLDLSGTSITRLPNNLSISGGLNLRYTDITRLPNNLSVGGNLDICYTGISSLPDNLKVGGHLHLHPEEITNIACRKLLRDGDYTVFAAWLNGKYCVVFNEKIYTLAEFFSGVPEADVERAVRDCLAELKQRRKGTGCSTTWINVSDCLPELDTPVFGGWFSDNGNFIWGCYVRTRFANATDWVWATAEHFGEGEWLFDDDYPVEFWMPLPGKPELAGGAA
ncbi:hypothetical protein [Candidatus Sodalis sp. SoCistrobi]|uniref:hypothetical protein n=1 Tax=Candidatus Sodalis sp. SoCistrobi TaxID=1922216 RepID=UPI000938B9F1|nr:hypothetical protein [Candidatus Sodalis sp. SoCistrobi]